MQQGIKKLQWFEYLKVVFLKILNTLLCWVFANQVTFCVCVHACVCVCVITVQVQSVVYQRRQTPRVSIHSNNCPKADVHVYRVHTYLYAYITFLPLRGTKEIKCHYN